jgi:hypothetical protein
VLVDGTLGVWLKVALALEGGAGAAMAGLVPPP